MADREKDRRSAMAHSTVNAPAKKGGAGAYSWGKAEDVTDYEPVGTAGEPKVSTDSTGPAAAGAPASQQSAPDRQDKSQFPSLGASKATVQQGHKGRSLTFYIFGSPVKMSPSPDIHNPGFAKNGLPHTYERFDSPEIADVMKVLRADGCGGGSVTIPHKESILPEMDRLGDAAHRIGAVNTVTKLPDGKFRGDNTDWLGIKNLVEARLGAAGKRPAELTCLLCGAGGTARAAAYALQRMGVDQVYIYNRTTSRAVGLAEEFGFRVCEDIAEVGSLARLDVVVNTLPGSTDFTMPDAAVETLRRCRPVVLEASYIPRRTAFLKQAMASGCQVIEGIEMLYEQGCEQCKIWTGMAAPRFEIAKSLCNALFSQASSHPAREKMEPIAEIPKALADEVDSRKGSSGRSGFQLLAGAAAVAVAAAALMAFLKRGR